MGPLNSKNLSGSFYRHPFIWLTAILLTVLPAFFFAKKLTLESDFKRLLPSDKQSVIVLNRIIEKVGGVGSLAIAIECEDYKATERFMEDLAVELRKLPEKYVRFLDYNVSKAKQFFKDNRYLYMELEDLKEIHDRLAKKIRYEKLQQNPFYLSLEEDEAEFDLSDIEEKYKGKTSKYDGYTDGYFFGENNKLAVMLVRPHGSSTGMAFSKDLMAKVQAEIDKLDPKSYHPSMTTSFTGKYKRTIEEYDQLLTDVLETLAICLFLVALVIYFYFWRFRVIWFLTLPLGIGVLWTFALTKLHIGYLNSQTAFLGSIIIGNGVNSGIILLGRYFEERRQKKKVEDAIRTAVRTTWLGTLTAAITTSAAFAALSFSEIKGFSQFGFIGGLGMTFCWLATYCTLPPLLVISERIRPIVRDKRTVPNQWASILHPIAALVSHSPRLIGLTGIFLAVASVGFFLRFAPNALEYDFSKLKNKPTQKQMEHAVGDRVDKIFGKNLSPAVILLDHEDQAKDVCDAIMKREENLSEVEKTIDACMTLNSYLPQNQKEKLKVIQQIKVLLRDKSLNFAKKYRKEIDDFREAVNLKEIKLADLPGPLKRNYEELDGRLGRITYVYPRPTATLTYGKRLIKFADVLQSVRLPDGSVVHMSGDAAIFADLLRAVIHDGPLATLFSFLGVAFLVIISMRRIRSVVYILGGLLFGIIFMLGLEALLHIKLNFFNFIALPVTFGIGVDYGVNLFQRYRIEGNRSVPKAIGTVGGAIILCSLTTIIGYSSLLTARNQALASFGWLALLGEFSCLFASIVVMPAFLYCFDECKRQPSHCGSERRKQPRSELNPKDK